MHVLNSIYFHPIRARFDFAHVALVENNACTSDHLDPGDYLKDILRLVMYCVKSYLYMFVQSEIIHKM